MTAVRGMDAILSGGTQFITFEEGKPMTLLFIDWFEDLMAIREHYEASLNPRYVRCPGKEICPLCHANPEKYPSLKIKFRVYDPADEKVKLVSLAKTHIQKLNTEFNLEEVDPTKEFVTVYRSGKSAGDTSYSARMYRPDEAKGKPAYIKPNAETLDMPDLLAQVTAHTPEQIQGFMNALLAGVQQQGQFQQQQGGYQQQGQFQQQGYDQGQQQGGFQQQQYDQGQFQQGQFQQGQFQHSQFQQGGQQVQGYDQGQQQGHSLDQGQQGGYQQQQGGFPPQGGQQQGNQQSTQRKLPF